MSISTRTAALREFIRTQLASGETDKRKILANAPPRITKLYSSETGLLSAINSVWASVYAEHQEEKVIGVKDRVAEKAHHGADTLRSVAQELKTRFCGMNTRLPPEQDPKSKMAWLVPVGIAVVTALIETKRRRR